ncbi:ParB/RepB/Spo0J family partition protein [Sporomusa sphaeroides]|uniref:ParB/RepB/Spo0J family partition protein n=1 Tax=Sporomusa sphaeroides TaxID=47679 RepID=UPI003DA0148D
MIINIDPKRISPHPDNPRKDLGDLSELAESIKVNGILQNLTVVPQLAMRPGYCTACNLYNGAVGKCKSDYDKSERPPCPKWDVRDDFVFTVVIGHRRLAAAKLAGLTEVPCVISDMDYKRQLATMLLENMQRNDLTIYEQAQGFQMLLNFGETLDNISAQTGFSESTIRRRVKLLELNKDKFKKSVERGATLQDYAELDKIKDIKMRNSVLDKIGTPNFKYELQRAIDKETSNFNKSLIIQELKKFATQVESSNGLKYVASYSTAVQPVITVPDDVSIVEYFYYINSSGYIYLYKKQETNKSTTADPAWLIAQRKRDDHRAELNEISARAYRLRYEFVKSISNAVAKKNIGTVIAYALRGMIDEYYLDSDDLRDLLDFGDKQEDEDEEWLFDQIKDMVNAQPERHILLATYLMLDSEREYYYGWDNRYEDNRVLNTVYDFLIKLGYELSDEEQALQDGTHELYVRDVESQDEDD